jgi:hypothetical protein
MYFLSWIIVGLIMGWLTRKLLKEGRYGRGHKAQPEGADGVHAEDAYPA